MQGKLKYLRLRPMNYTYTISHLETLSNGCLWGYASMIDAFPFYIS